MLLLCLLSNLPDFNKNETLLSLPGEIYSQQVLDREKESLYSVPVAAIDNGGRMTFTLVHISISDQNDNVPQFLAQEYKRTILDTTTVNSTVLKVTTGIMA